MYNLNVTYKAGSKEDAHDFYREVTDAGIVAATRGEAGNLRYDYYFSAEQENELLLIENWQDKEAQQNHYTLPHIKKLAQLKEKYGIETSFEEV